MIKRRKKWKWKKFPIQEGNPQSEDKFNFAEEMFFKTRAPHITLTTKEVHSYVHTVITYCQTVLRDAIPR